MLNLGVVNIQYFEDVFSPTITMKMEVVNSGPTIKDDQGKSQSIYSGLPLRGGERVAVKDNEKTLVHLTLLHQKNISMFQV